MATTQSISRRSFLASAAGAAVAGRALARTATANEAAAAGSYQVGIYTRPWDAFDYRLALDAIAEAGFQHAGLMTTTTAGRRLVIDTSISPQAAEKIGHEVKSRGMQIPSVYGGGIPVSRSLEAGIEGMRRLIDNCVAAGAKSLLMGGIGPGKLYDLYYKAIAETCDYAAEKGLPITVKPHGGANATGAQCRKCIESVGHDNFSLWYDPGNIFYYSNGELNPVDDAATVAGLVRVGICIKDFHMPLKNGKPTRDVWITPGTGRVDFPRVMSVLRKGGFTAGQLVIECVTRPDPKDLAGLLAEAKKARRYVEQLVKTV